MKKKIIVLFLCSTIISVSGCSVNTETVSNHDFETNSSHITSASYDSTSLSTSSTSDPTISDISSESDTMDAGVVGWQTTIQRVTDLEQQILDSSIKKLEQPYENDLLCSVGNYELHLKTEESYSGDTYEFGVFDNSKDSWVVPYSNKYKLLTNFIDTQDFLEQKRSSVTFYDIGNNILYIKEYLSRGGYNGQNWCYDFLNDRLVKLNGTPVKYFDDKIIINQTPMPQVYDFQTGETRSFIESTNDDSYLYSVKCTYYNSILIEKSKKARYGYEFERYQLYDFEGKMLFDLFGYSLDSDYISKASYNKDKFFFVGNGKDSGIYACLIDQDGVLLFDPIRLPDERGKSFEIYLLDDCAVVSTFSYKKGQYDTFDYSIIDTMTNVVYEFDGTEVFRYEK